jgi:hypothetical protein
MSMRTIVIGWWGPSTPEDVRLSDLENGLYFLGGRRKYERQDQIQYFGIMGGPYRRRLNRWHHAMSQITKNSTVWLGQIEYPRRFNRKHLELAEGCLIYFWGRTSTGTSSLPLRSRCACSPGGSSPTARPARIASQSTGKSLT